MRCASTMACRLGWGSVERSLSCEPHEQPHQCGNAVRVVPLSSSKSASWRGRLCTAYEIACVDFGSQAGFAEFSDPLTCVACRPHHVRRLASQGAQLNPLARRGPNTTDSAAPPSLRDEGTGAANNRGSPRPPPRPRNAAAGCPRSQTAERPRTAAPKTHQSTQSTGGHEHYHQPPARRSRPATKQPALLPRHVPGRGLRPPIYDHL